MLEQERNPLLILWNLTTKHRFSQNTDGIGLNVVRESEEPKYVSETLRKHQEIYDNNYMHVIPEESRELITFAVLTIDCFTPDFVGAFRREKLIRNF